MTQNTKTRLLSRSMMLVALLALCGTSALAVKLRASANPEPAPPAEPAPTAVQDDDDEEEEHGGDVLFHVIARSQKHSVIYSHDAHLAAGLECADCHDSLFKKEFEGNHFKMSDINKGKACGVCHQKEPPAGVKGSFEPKGNCAKCHTVRVREPEKRQR